MHDIRDAIAYSKSTSARRAPYKRKTNSCSKCGAFFDVGRNYCVELGCGVPVSTTVRVRKRYQYAKKPHDPIKARFSGCRRRAEIRGFGFDLTIEFITEFLKRPCIYCSDEGNIQIDRKDNSLGYLQANVVPACKRCNTVKSMYLSYDQMLIVAKALGWCNGYFQ